MLSSQMFENKLNINNFQELEDAFQSTKKFFENLNEQIKSHEVSDRFPAYCFQDNQIHIKLPTYKVRIINNTLSHEELTNLLGSIGHYGIYEETNVCLLPSLEPVQSTAIHCLESNLSANQKTAEDIKKALLSQNILSERCVTSAIHIIAITVDEQGFIHIK